MELILTITLVIILNITEALTDFYIIQDAKGYGRKWHKTNAVYYVIIILLVYVISKDLRILFFLISTRFFVFNSLLNWLRKRDIWYRGSKGVDGILKPYEKIVWFISLVLFVGSFILNFR